jgi:hypothetical protein
MTLEKARFAKRSLDKALPEFKFGQTTRVVTAGLMAQEALAWCIREMEKHDVSIRPRA